MSTGGKQSVCGGVPSKLMSESASESTSLNFGLKNWFGITSSLTIDFVVYCLKTLLKKKSAIED